jgi:exosortase A
MAETIDERGLGNEGNGDAPVTAAEMAMTGAGWGRALILLAVVLGSLFVAFFETAESIVSIWMRSDTFAHGFLIIPISLWLVWEKREGLKLLSPGPAYLPILLMLPVGFGWLLGSLVDVLVVQQLAFAALLVLAIWAVLGNRVARYLAFPILFLFFGVPIGEELTYPMVNFTADFTVRMLELTGIPVFRDGTFFSIPSGDWSVVEACSGVRYLIASVTLGVLYAYLTYNRFWKRLLFVAFSVVVPVIANGFRAYLIVMIAHLSDMKLAVGVDHLIYGWVFFGIVITIMFFIGSFWRDPPREERLDVAASDKARMGSALAVAVLAIAAAAIWPGVAWSLRTDVLGDQAVKLVHPGSNAGWTESRREHWDWRPHIVGADGERYDFFVQDEGGVPVGLYLGIYRAQRQDAELLNWQNQMVPEKDPLWRDKQQIQRPILVDGEEMLANQSRLASNRTGSRLLVWSWYRIGEYYTANPYVGKLAEVWSLFSSGRRDGSLIVVAAPYIDDEVTAERAMQSFINALLPGIEDALDQALQPKS